jgi:hypothetical protein
MSQLVRLDALRTAVRRRADLENNLFVADAELNDYINRAIADLWDLLQQVNGDMRLEREAPFTTAANQRTYALPADFQFVTGVFWDTGGGQLSRMEQYMGTESQDDWIATGWTYFGRVMYRLQAGNIRFVPIPSGTYTVTLKYTPNATILVADSDTVDSVNYWDDFVIWSAVATALAKQETDPGYAVSERERVKHRILLAAERSMDGPQRIQDVKRGRPWPYARRWS